MIDPRASLDDLAILHARLSDGFATVDTVCTDAGLTPAVLTEATALWSARLARSPAEASAYTKSFRAEKARLKQKSNPRIVAFDDTSPAPPLDLDATAMLAASPVRARPLPFSGGAPSDEFRASLSMQSVPNEPRPMGDPDATCAPTDPIDPSAAAPFEGARLLLLDRYAAFAAALRLGPERSEQTFMDFDVPNAEARARIHDLWRRRFSARPALKEQFDALVARLMNEPPNRS